MCNKNLQRFFGLLWRIALLLFVLLPLFVRPAPLFAQEADASRGWLWNIILYGYTYPGRTLPPDRTGQSPGSIKSQIFLLNNTFGYQPNRYLAFTADVPVYFVSFCQRAPDGTKTCGANNGLGNIGLSLGLRFENVLLNFYSTGTARLPTGDENKGLGVGSTTASWTNTISHRFLRTMPFLTLIVANSLSQTSSFVRPFISKGFVLELSGGLEQELHRYFHVGGSFYAVFPKGTQTTFGRLTTPKVVPSLPVPVPGPHFAPQQGETTGTAELTRDNGGSVWA